MLYRIVQGTFRDGSGKVVPSGTITVVQNGLSTPIDLYPTSTGGVATTSVTSLQDGTFKFWVYDTGVETYDLTLSAIGYISKTILSVAPHPYAGTVINGEATNITGIIKGVGNVLTAATAGTDYLAPPSGTSILKANSGGALANATVKTDYAPATSGTSILKGSGDGGFSNTTANDIYTLITSLVRPALILKTGSFTLDTTYAFTQTNITSSGATTVTIPVPSNTYKDMWFDFDRVGGTTGVSFTITGGTNWWNSVLIGATFVMSDHIRIWCDGTYWYGTPIDVGIEYSQGNALNAGNQTTWTSLSISSLVPVFAKSITGALAGTTAYITYISNVSSGYNPITAYGNTSSAFSSFVKYPLFTPQNIWYKNSASGSTTITIVGWGC